MALNNDSSSEEAMAYSAEQGSESAEVRSQELNDSPEETTPPPTTTTTTTAPGALSRFLKGVYGTLMFPKKERDVGGVVEMKFLWSCFLYFEVNRNKVLFVGNKSLWCF